MSLSTSSHAKSDALQSIKNYRVSELQALLDVANLSRQGHKRDLLQRCKLLITSNFTPQIANKIHQINNTRTRPTRSHHVSSSTSSSSSSSRNHPIVLPKTPPIEVLPQANHIQFINLPFFEKMRIIESTNMPVDWHTFSPMRFSLNETDIDLIRKNIAKVFLRLAPTIIHERHNDVLPPYLFVQCNNQPVINNNITKQVGSQAHSISFPTDITDKIILKANASNTINYLWLQSPTTMSFKNLPRSYTISIQLVNCVSIDTLFDLIIKREPYTNKTDNDNDSDIEIEDLGLMTTRHRVSLLCPITQSLINAPAKSSYCSHLTCFDLKAFLLMNERRLQWTCPLCKKSASFESLRIDERLKTILSNVPPNCSTVEIDSSIDCQYILDSIKQEKVDVTDTTHLQQNNEDESIQNSSNKSRYQSDESDCIVLSSGSESEDEDEDEDEDGEINNSSLPSTPILDQNGDIDERCINKMNDSASQSPHTSHSTISPIISTIDDTNYWEDLAQITYDLSSDASEKFSNRKRSNSSTSSILSSSSSLKSNDACHRRKRNKQPSSTKSRTTDIEVITLSSSDSSDNDDQSS
ncbi:unnamed protein product [Rotaria sordida]|uniref:Uncharacterized protein n=2 Tax=Rotaria sordida TaxID=392033 RepID=A0A813ZLT7_9BILA|nr:unnamed protein product [Rotaria sordida]CAF0900784.1 unnamed protein product [Rotaria sordida]CAF3515662.1 unnamed protein product [Rotaria sordida]CAF3796064.1 unnamed protein product [Rotaria sordida]